MQKQNDTIDIITNYSVESYAVFQNIDRSILATNSFLERFGYQFVCIDLEELEKKFSSLFLTPKELKLQGKEMVRILNSNRLIPKKFFHALMNHASFGNQTIINNEVIFLKAINDFEGIIINNTIDVGLPYNKVENLKSLLRHLFNSSGFLKMETLIL